MTSKEVEAGLAAAGFVRQKQTATSHVKWVRDKNTVTVDAHLSPFSIILIKSMACQAGVSVKEFYAMCSKDGIKASKKSFLRGFLPSSD